MTTLIGGFLVWGGVGWLLDHWWGTRLMTPIGLILGMALGIYAVIAKLGKPNAEEMSPALRAASTTRRPSTTAQQLPEQPQRRDGPPPAATRRETECP